MNGNQLIYWLSYLGEGTWELFRRAVAQLAEPSEREEPLLLKLTNTLYYRLSDLGFVDFFPNRRRRWEVRPPLLASFFETPEMAVLCGGRSPTLIAGLKSAVLEADCTIETFDRLPLPDHIVLAGNSHKLEALASQIKIRLSPDFAEECIAGVVPIHDAISTAPTGELMIGWARRYFDLR